MAARIIAETHDWNGEEYSAGIARSHMQATIDALTPEKLAEWVEAFDAFVDRDEEIPAWQEILEAQTAAELAGLEGWAETPDAGHGVMVRVDR